MSVSIMSAAGAVVTKIAESKAIAFAIKKIPQYGSKVLEFGKTLWNKGKGTVTSLISKTGNALASVKVDGNELVTKEAVSESGNSGSSSSESEKSGNSKTLSGFLKGLGGTLANGFTLAMNSDSSQGKLLRSGLKGASILAIVGVAAQGICLAGTKLAELTIKNSKILQSNLRGANLPNATFEKVDFSGSDMTGIQLPNSQIQQCNLQQLELKGSNLQNSRINGCNLQQANLQGADLRGADFSQSDLRGANLKNAQIAGCNFSQAKTAGVDFTKCLQAGQTPQRTYQQPVQPSYQIGGPFTQTTKDKELSL